MNKSSIFIPNWHLRCKKLVSSVLIVFMLKGLIHPHKKNLPITFHGESYKFLNVNAPKTIIICKFNVSIFLIRKKQTSPLQMCYATIWLILFQDDSCLLLTASASHEVEAPLIISAEAVQISKASTRLRSGNNWSSFIVSPLNFYILAWKCPEPSFSWLRSLWWP